MRKYTNKLQLILENFLKSNFKNKIKIILKVLGLRFVLYHFLFLILSFFFKNKSFFMRGLMFDLQKKLTNYVAIENKHKEKFLLFTNDNIISKEVFVREEFDLSKLQKTLNFLKTKKHIENLYDVGSNLGVICIPAVNRGLVKKAYAVEAEPRNFELLKTNVVLNKLESKITLFNYALSDEDGVIVEMELAADNSGDHRIVNDTQFNYRGEENRKTLKLKSVKFDSLFNNINSERDLIWIDTQGYEPKILNGAHKLIESKAPIVVEFWPYGLKRNNMWNEMLKILEKFDYFVDLSSKNIKVEKISHKSLTDLTGGWQKEEKNKHSLFTDLILLRE